MASGVEIPDLVIWAVVDALRSTALIRVEIAAPLRDAILKELNAHHPALLERRGYLLEPNATSASELHLAIQESASEGWSVRYTSPVGETTYRAHPIDELVCVPGVTGADGGLEPDGQARARAARRYVGRERSAICFVGGVKAAVTLETEAEQMWSIAGAADLLEVASQTTAENIVALLALYKTLPAHRLRLVTQWWHVPRFLTLIAVASPRVLAQVRITPVKSELMKRDLRHTWKRELQLLRHIPRNLRESKNWADGGSRFFDRQRLLDGIRDTRHLSTRD